MNEKQKVITRSLVGNVERDNENEAMQSGVETVESGSVMLATEAPQNQNNLEELNQSSTVEKVDFKDGASQSRPGITSSQPSIIHRSIANENRRKNRLTMIDMMRGSKTVKPGSNGSEVCKTTDVVKGIGKEPEFQGSLQKPGSSSPSPVSLACRDYLHPRYKHWPHLTVNGYPRREKASKRKCSMYCSNCGAAGHHEEGNCDATVEEQRWYQLSKEKDSALPNSFEKTKRRVETNLVSQGVHLSSQMIKKLSPAVTAKRLLVLTQFTQRAINYLAVKGYQKRVRILVSVMNFRMQILRESELDDTTWLTLYQSLFDFVEDYCDKV